MTYCFLRIILTPKLLLLGATPLIGVSAFYPHIDPSGTPAGPAASLLPVLSAIYLLTWICAASSAPTLTGRSGTLLHSLNLLTPGGPWKILRPILLAWILASFLLQGLIFSFSVISPWSEIDTTGLMANASAMAAPLMTSSFQVVIFALTLACYRVMGTWGGILTSLILLLAGLSASSEALASAAFNWTPMLLLPAALNAPDLSVASILFGSAHALAWLFIGASLLLATLTTAKP